MGKRIRIILVLLWSLGLAISACMPSPPNSKIYLPTFIPTQIKQAPTANPVAPPILPTTEFTLPTLDPYRFFGTDIAGQPGSFSTQLPANALQAAKQSLAQTLGISVEQISTISIVEVTWPDTCFGTPGTHIACEPFSMPGYQITLAANSQNYLYYTDREGTRVLLAPQP